MPAADREFYAGTTVLITGASSGIGRALALQLVSMGATVFGVSRNEEKLQKVFHETRGMEGKFVPYAADISSLKGCEKVFNAFTGIFSNLDILVNNAGIGHFSAFEKMPVSDYELVLNTNLMAPMHLTRLFVDLLKESKKPRVVNMCSSGAYYGIAFRSVYCASKAAMRAWSQALAVELARFGIEVTCVVPGAVLTGFFDHSLGRSPRTHRLPGRVMPADVLAKRILKAVRGKGGELVVSWPSRAILYLSVAAPWLLRRGIRKAALSEEPHIYGNE